MATELGAINLDKFFAGLTAHGEVWGHGEYGYILATPFSSHSKEEVEQAIKELRDAYESLKDHLEDLYE